MNFSSNDIKGSKILLPQQQETRESSHEVVTATPAKDPKGSVSSGSAARRDTNARKNK